MFVKAIPSVIYKYHIVCTCRSERLHHTMAHGNCIWVCHKCSYPQACQKLSFLIGNRTPLSLIHPCTSQPAKSPTAFATPRCREWQHALHFLQDLQENSMEDLSRVLLGGQWARLQEQRSNGKNRSNIHNNTSDKEICYHVWLIMNNVRQMWPTTSVAGITVSSVNLDSPWSEGGTQQIFSIAPGPCAFAWAWMSSVHTVRQLYTNSSICCPASPSS